MTSMSSSRECMVGEQKVKASVLEVSTLKTLAGIKDRLLDDLAVAALVSEKLREHGIKPIHSQLYPSRNLDFKR